MSFVSPPVARACATEAGLRRTPHIERLAGAVMFTDIAGFTALTERLARLGPAGAERLTQHLNTYFGALLNLVTEHGGEVVTFAGDGLLALWRADTEDLATVTLRATQCGVAVQMALNNYLLSATERLALTVAVGAGRLAAAHVGGVHGRWEYILGGAPLIDLEAAEAHAQPGNVVLTPDAWRQLGERCSSRPLPNGAVRLQEIRAPIPLRPTVPVAQDGVADAALRGYVPLAVLDRLEAGHTAWLAELRRVSAVFLKVGGLDFAPDGILERLHGITRTIQETVARWEGAINKFLVTRDGVICVAAFGVPPQAHEDDPVRAVHTALAMREACAGLGHASAVGVATGWVFCGPVGSEQRREYTMIGDVVNVAARLMQAAYEDVWCDDATRQAAQARFRFETVPPVSVRGKAETVAVFRPSGRSAVAAAVAPLVGRVRERTYLREHMEALSAGDGQVVVVEGEAGIGKSRLVTDFVEQARARGFPCFCGAGDAVEKASPYHAWRPILFDVFGLEQQAPGDMRRQRVTAALRDRVDEEHLTPLLNGVLGLDLPDTEVTAQMTGQVRADNTHQLVVRLLQRAASGRPLVLVLEDAHWLDSASWALALWISRVLSPLLLVIVTRPMGESAPPEFRQLLRAHEPRHVRLGALPLHEAVELVCRRLGVSQLPPTVATLIRDRAQGNPFFSEEIAYALRDSGLLRIANGRCAIDPSAGDLRTAALPETLQGVITSRIDRLTPAQQLALKTASVIGRVFAFRVLRDIYPVDSDRSLLPDYLDALERLDLTPLESPEPELAYVFKHIITQEVAYNLMLFAQRQQLHTAVAEWYERTYAQDLEPHFPLLAHHWAQARDRNKAIAYCANAGAQALANGADRESVHFFTQALELDAERTGVSDEDDPALHRSTWHRQLAEAHSNLGQLVEAKHHVTEAMALLGWPMPATRKRMIGAISWHAGVQTLHRLFPHVFHGRARGQRARAIEEVRCHQLLGEVHYFNGELLPFIVNSACSLNFAEWAGDSAELIRAYAGACVVTGAMGLHRLAEQYSRQAHSVAARVNHLPARAYAAMCTGVLYMGLAKWEDALAHASEGERILGELGETRLRNLCNSVRFLVELIRGEYDAAWSVAEDITALATRSENLDHKAWGSINQGAVLLRRGDDLAAARTCLEEGIALLEQGGDRVHLLRAKGFLAVLQLRQGDHTGALATAREAMELATRAGSTSTLMEGYAGVAEVHLTLWERGDHSQAEQARTACTALTKLAKKFPLAEARALALGGWLASLEGRTQPARKLWDKAVKAAERRKTPYELGLTYELSGQHSTAGSDEARSALSEAQMQYERLGCLFEARRVQAALTRAHA